MNHLHVKLYWEGKQSRADLWRADYKCKRVFLLHCPFKCQYFPYLYSWIHSDRLHAGFMTTTRQRYADNA